MYMYILRDSAFDIGISRPLAGSHKLNQTDRNFVLHIWIGLTRQCDVLYVITHQSVRSVQRKNCEPFVFAPLLAIDRMPATNRVHRCDCCSL